MAGSYTIYKHTNLANGKVYIGITSQRPKRRWQNGNNYKSNIYFDNAIQKYGWDGFAHNILFENLSEEEAAKKEIELIAYYDSTDRTKGYNIDKGGVHRNHSLETRQKMRESAKGRVLTEEQKEKMSKSHIKNKVYCVELDLAFDSAKQAGIYLNKDYSHIYSVCKGKRQTACGYHWKYVN